MEDLLAGLMRDNVAEVKVVLASVALALAAYQLVLIAVGYARCDRRSSAPAPRRPPTAASATRSPCCSWSSA